MFHTAASGHVLQKRVPAVILAAVLGISLAGCAPGPGSTASPTETSEVSMTGTPTSEGTIMPSTEPAGESDRELDVSLAHPLGRQFGYGSSSTATTISLESECSTHPSLEEPST